VRVPCGGAKRLSGSMVAKRTTLAGKIEKGRNDKRE